MFVHLDTLQQTNGINRMLEDPDVGVQEQAWSIMRNLAEDEDGIDMVFQEMEPDFLLDTLTAALEMHDTSLRSRDTLCATDITLQVRNLCIFLLCADNPVHQAAFVLANLCNGDIAVQDAILSHASLLKALRSCLAHVSVEVRRPAVSCVWELVRSQPGRRRELSEAGIIGTLRHIVEWSGAAAVSPGGRMMSGAGMPAEDDKEVRGIARLALNGLVDHSMEVEM